jgi:hypothetical protein
MIHYKLFELSSYYRLSLIISAGWINLFKNIKNVNGFAFKTVCLYNMPERRFPSDRLSEENEFKKRIYFGKTPLRKIQRQKRDKAMKLTKRELAYMIAVLELSEYTRTCVAIKDIKVKGAELTAEVIFKEEGSGGIARYKDRKYRLPMFEPDRAFSPIFFGIEGEFLNEGTKRKLKKVYGGIIPEKESEKFGKLRVEWISVPDVTPYARGAGVNFYYRDHTKNILGFIHGFEWIRERRKNDQLVRIFILTPDSPKWGNSSGKSALKLDELKDCVRTVLDKEKLYGEIKNNINVLTNE